MQNLSSKGKSAFDHQVSKSIEEDATTLEDGETSKTDMVHINKDCIQMRKFNITVPIFRLRLKKFAKNSRHPGIKRRNKRNRKLHRTRNPIRMMMKILKVCWRVKRWFKNGKCCTILSNELFSKNYDEIFFRQSLKNEAKILRKDLKTDKTANEDQSTDGIVIILKNLSI